MVQLDGSINRATRRYLRELKKTWKPRTVIFTHIKFVVSNARNLSFAYDSVRSIIKESFAAGMTRLLLVVLSPSIVGIQQIWSDSFQKLDVVIRVKLGHLLI